MFKFLIKCLIFISINLLLFGLFALISLSVVTKQFPPSVEMIKYYSSNFLNLKENYIRGLNKSTAAIESLENSNTISADESSSLQTKNENSELRIEVLHLKSELGRLQDENKLLLKKLKAGRQ
jgi:hypothetical protein